MSGQRFLTLALGGGGVNCFAHLGVLRALENHRIKIAGIAGTSAGALVAALAGVGASAADMQAIFARLDIEELSRHHPPDRKALFGLSGWKPVLEEIFGDRTIESLAFPVALPVVDLDANRAEVLTRGRLVDALMAAIAIPGIFPPQQLGGRTLIDGGVLDPVPAALARRLAPAHPTAAVMLAPPREDWSRHPFPRLLNAVPWMRFLGRLRFTQALGVYVRAADLTNRMLAEIRLESARPDIVIRPDVNHLGLFDRVDIEAIASEGERAASSQLEEFYA